MTRLNKKATDHRIDATAPRLAGGAGMLAARQDPEALLRRTVLACLLWEKLAYEDGSDTVRAIRELIPQVAPEVVAQIALEARQKQKLRHVPLLIAREMARLPQHKLHVGDLLPQIITRADMLTDFLALYWKDGRQPLSKQVKRGLAAAFVNFDEYQLAKYDRDGVAVKLRDVLFLSHAKPKDDAQRDLWSRLVAGKLATPDTWEVALSRGQDKREAWTRLIETRKLPALAFLRNLRNIEQAGVDRSMIYQAFKTLRSDLLLPLNFLAAQRAAPDFTREIEDMMLDTYARLPRLLGWTVCVLDVSGSMIVGLSDKSNLSRLDAGVAMLVLAAEQAEHSTLYITAGDDRLGVHATRRLIPVRGFALAKQIEILCDNAAVGRGGIFTRQMLEFIQQDLKGQTPDRIIVFSDSQDCERQTHKIPQPFGLRNYIVDVSAHRRGVNYASAWTAEVSGFSEHFLTFVAGMEGAEVADFEPAGQ